MSFSAIDLRNRYGIHLTQKHTIVRIQYGMTPEKNSEGLFYEKFLAFGLDYWRKNAKISSRFKKH